MNPIKKGLAGLAAVLLAFTGVAVSASSASAHTGDLKVTAVCNPATGQYDLTAKLTLTQSDLGGKTAWRVGNETFQGTPSNATGMPNGFEFTGPGTFNLAPIASLPGTTTGFGPWVYAFSKWSDGFSKGSDGQLTTRLAGDCKKPDTKDASASVTVVDPSCAAPGTASIVVNNAALSDVRVLPTAPGTYTVHFAATAGHVFADGSKTKAVTYTVMPQVTIDCTPTRGSPTFTVAVCVAGQDHPQGENTAAFPAVEGGTWVVLTPSGQSLTLKSGTYGEDIVKSYGYGTYNWALVDDSPTDAFKVETAQGTFVPVDPASDCRVIIETPAVDVKTAGVCGTYGTVTPGIGEHVARSTVDFDKETGAYSVTFYAADGFKFANGEKTITVTGNAGAYGGDCPTTKPCETSSSRHFNTLDDWYLGETRTAGHNEITGSGLHIYTDDASSQAKAAGYLPVDFDLKDLGDGNIASMMNYIASQGPRPGLQLGVDFDRNGSADGYLVGESVYGNDWWMTNGTPATFTAPQTGGGYGSARHGTINEWLTVYPDAKVKAIGYSLGSGVKGDGTITRLTFGCVDYTFGLTAAKAPSVIVTDETCATDEDGNYIGESINGSIEVTAENATSKVLDSEGNEVEDASSLPAGEYEVIVTGDRGYTFYEAPEGWTLYNDGTVHTTVTVEESECSFTEVTPDLLTFSDFCGTSEDTVNVPSGWEVISTDLETKTTVFETPNGQFVTVTDERVKGVGRVTATTEAGFPFVFAEGEGYTINEDGSVTVSHDFTDAACPIPALPPKANALVTTGVDNAGWIALAALAILGLGILAARLGRRKGDAQA